MSPFFFIVPACKSIINQKDQIDQLHKAATRGNVREFQLLLDRYSLICSRDQLGATPLHKAVLYGHFDLAKFIVLNFGPNILYLGDNVSVFFLFFSFFFFLAFLMKMKWKIMFCFCFYFLIYT